MSKRVRKNSYTISNSITNDLAIILVENKDIYAYLSDSNFKVNSTKFIKTKNIKSKYNKVLGFSIKQNNYHVLYTNDSRNKFSISFCAFKRQIDCMPLCIKNHSKFWILNSQL